MPNFTGNTCDSCVDGMYGANCSVQCSRGCEESHCSPSDGSCNCSKYYYGKTCEICIAGWYGEDCSKPCSLGCLENTCSSTNGKCVCKEYYRGDKCGVCVDGRYGEKCSKICGPGCLENNCSLTDGKCVCKDFYKGDKCDVCEDVRYGDGCLNAYGIERKITAMREITAETVSPEQNHQDETENFKTGAVTGGVIGAVVVLVAAVAITVFVKRRLSQKAAQDHENKRETTTPGGNATKPGPYETLNTSHIEKNDRRDTYSRLFTTGQAGMASASPSRSTVDLVNAVGGKRDKSGPYEILNATMLKENEMSNTYNSLFTTGQAAGADNVNFENISMGYLTISPDSHSYANTMQRQKQHRRGNNNTSQHMKSQAKK